MKATKYVRHSIWSNYDLHEEDWRDGYKEYLDINGLDYDPTDKDGLYDFMIQCNEDYLSDERANLNIKLNQPIIVIADLGLWDGRRSGYKLISSGNIRDCLYADADYAEWYVDKFGDLRATATHHDGANYYLYRVFKENISEEQMENFEEKIYKGICTRADINRYTQRLGDYIADVYGWDIPRKKNVRKVVS